MKYIQIISEKDNDIPYIISIHKIPEISHFISINEENYFHYVTTTENVFYFKVYKNDDLVGTVHCELFDKMLCMSILVIPIFQKRGIGTAILYDIQNGVLPLTYTHIKVSIDKFNSSSLRLFKKMDFTKISEEEDLIDFIWSV